MTKAYTLVTAVIFWFAIVLQFCISVPVYLQTGFNAVGAVVQLLSFFTVLSNLLAAIILAAALLQSQSGLVSFFRRGSVITAVTLYITIVGVVYNLVLRSLQHLEGLFKLANELMHLINPLLFIIFWLFFTPKQKLRLQQGLTWLWFPFIYLVYTLARGAAIHLYPYPFMNVDKLGYGKALINCFFVMIAFLVFDFLFFFINNKLSPQKQ
ncbi:Pr6Pr family membrane protein [Mucilaginibacter flavus]|uniref:Pr6Pr family membrane protein n=1 Tax=Mucilaginibacter flavus TaxID=931504 RepID=UPI0025B5655C|nr:Pr6Pr family membrane protein [Mucilaginibacter flavus]MDN3582706.1 Pr6Pr family membrane protein [Mucilaginibacter flavus]